MAAEDWFGVVEVAGDASTCPFLQAVVDLLDRVRPTQTDTSLSTIKATSTYVDLTIVHQSIPEATITMLFRGDYGASCSIVEPAEEYYRTDEADDLVSDQMLDELELLLTRVYTVKETTWRGRPVTTETSGPRPFEDPSVSSRVHLLTPFRARLPTTSLVTARREVSFRPPGTCSVTSSTLSLISQAG